MTPDTVVLEVAFVHLDDNASSAGAELWDEVDEQHLPIDLRRRLQANGLRTGLVEARCPWRCKNWSNCKQTNRRSTCRQGNWSLTISPGNNAKKCARDVEAKS